MSDCQGGERGQGRGPVSLGGWPEEAQNQRPRSPHCRPARGGGANAGPGPGPGRGQRASHLDHVLELRRERRQHRDLPGPQPLVHGARLWQLRPGGQLVQRRAKRKDVSLVQRGGAALQQLARQVPSADAWGRGEVVECIGEGAGDCLGTRDCSPASGGPVPHGAVRPVGCVINQPASLPAHARVRRPATHRASPSSTCQCPCFSVAMPKSPSLYVPSRPLQQEEGGRRAQGHRRRVRSRG
jgi:hypothetical protein